MFERDRQPKGPAVFAIHALCVSAFTLAAPPTVHRDEPSAEVPAADVQVLRADRLLDVSTGRMLHDAFVVIRGARIAAVGSGADPQDAAGARRIDLGDVTLLPGLMDMHTHLSFSLSGDFVHRAVHETIADAALHGVQHARVTLRAGFTTVRDLGSDGFVDVALMRAVERGDIDGPWIFPAGHAIGITGGHADATGFAPGILVAGPAAGVADGVNECVTAVREQIKYGAKVIKIMATAGVLSFEDKVGAQQMSFEEMKAVVDEAGRHGLKVAAHAHGVEGIKAAVMAGVASIEHGSMIDDEAMRMMIDHGCYLVPTTYLVDAIDLDGLPPKLRGKAESILPIARQNLRKAIAAGVPIAFGTDAAVYPHGDNAHEFAVLVQLGMTPIAAIRAATIDAARLLGVTDRGALSAGLLADVIAVPGDPLADIQRMEQVSFVMQGGRVVRGG